MPFLEILKMIRVKNSKLVATDLDGTFLRNDHSISEKSLDSLRLLGEKQILRVVATGRNLRKVMEVIPGHVPFDYIVYSSGAGVYDWTKREHLFHKNISSRSSNQLIQYFVQQDYNFYAFDEAPENHRLWYHRGKQESEEFNRYFSFHNSVSQQLPSNGELANGLYQFMLIIPENEAVFQKMKEEIESRFDEVRVIRSSSPVTKGYIWMEVFHREVSKGNGVGHLCEMLGVSPEETLGVGNDYNDLDLLRFTGRSFIAANAPHEIRGWFEPAPSNEEDAFAYAVQHLLQ